MGSVETSSISSMIEPGVGVGEANSAEWSMIEQGVGVGEANLTEWSTIETGWVLERPAWWCSQQ